MSIDLKSLKGKHQKGINFILEKGNGLHADVTDFFSYFSPKFSFEHQTHEQRIVSSEYNLKMQIVW
jgi:hypothetical protein